MVHLLPGYPIGLMETHKLAKSVRDLKGSYELELLRELRGLGLRSEDILEGAVTRHIVNEIIGKVERLTLTNRSELGCKDKNLICVRNGVLNLTTKELLPHSSDHNLL